LPRRPPQTNFLCNAFTYAADCITLSKNAAARASVNYTKLLPSSEASAYSMQNWIRDIHGFEYNEFAGCIFNFFLISCFTILKKEII
jgi:hypothetical protein